MVVTGRWTVHDFEAFPYRTEEEGQFMSELLQVGDSAPAFKGQTDGETSLSVSDYLGRWLVLYFYPRAHTSGCTREGQAFNALLDEFEALNAAVVGVSTDKSGTLAKFRDKHNFRFTLLSDAGKETCAAFGTLKGHGKSANRVTYLIDPQGVVQALWPRVRVDGHAEKVLARLKELEGGREA
jgi:peroxiredoxin Q/BCP